MLSRQEILCILYFIKAAYIMLNSICIYFVWFSFLWEEFQYNPFCQTNMRISHLFRLACLNVEMEKRATVVNNCMPFYYYNDNQILSILVNSSTTLNEKYPHEQSSSK